MKNTNKKTNQTYQPLITEIKSHSLDDGKGIRSVIFFKGCPLSCEWCHNPETINPNISISYDKNACLDFKDCINVCELHALDPENPLFVNRDLCTLCGKCTDACASEALSLIGNTMSVEDIIEHTLRYQPFYKNSEGGVTLSGGEATLYMDFCEELLKSLKQKDINVTLETSGYFHQQRFFDKIYPYLDQIYFDIKIFDNKLHKKHCGKNNVRILENFIALKKRADDGEVPILARIPLIPDITATKDNLQAIARFLISTGETQVSLLPYNPIWSDEANKVGMPAEPTPHTWLTEEHLQKCKHYVSGLDIVN